MKALAVTGFVPNAFEAQHFQPGQAEALGTRLKEALGEQLLAYDPWEFRHCWAAPIVVGIPNLLPSDANPPADRYKTPQDAVISNVVLLQRYEWMARAALERPDVDVFAWIEYTVLKQRNVTPEVLQRFMQAIAEKPFDAVSLPGCWPKGPIDDSRAHWRFVGSCWVCPRKYVAEVFHAIRTVTKFRAVMTGKLSWDMNTMAYVELLDVLPIRWYQANHDETQFTNF